jgi:hypothetical protein
LPDHDEVGSTRLASPKSVIFGVRSASGGMRNKGSTCRAVEIATRSAPDNKTFAGFRSRWTMPRS